VIDNSPASSNTAKQLSRFRRSIDNGKFLTAWLADWNGVVYRVNIPVDEEIEDRILDHADGDPAVEAALAWLLRP
jgi:hypothetical protein